MSVVTHTVGVTRTVEVTIDESKFTAKFLAEFREHFYPYSDIRQHIEHLAWLAAADRLEDGGTFADGYGLLAEMGIKLRVLPGAEVEL